MEIPEPGEEGYIVKVTEENRECLSKIYGRKLSLDSILNYDPNQGSLLSDRFYSYRESTEDDSYISTGSTEITVGQLQKILFIDSLEK